MNTYFILTIIYILYIYIQIIIKQKENINLRGCWRLGRDSKEGIWKGLEEKWEVINSYSN